MNRVVHFEFGAVNTARAVEFYKNVFGWKRNSGEARSKYG